MDAKQTSEQYIVLLEIFGNLLYVPLVQTLQALLLVGIVAFSDYLTDRRLKGYRYTPFRALV